MTLNNSCSGRPSLTRFLLALLISAINTGCAIVEPQVNAVIVDDQVVSEASASVELERAGVRAPVAPGTTVEVGDIIRTGENATAVLLLENGSVEVIMLENTEIHISSLWVEIGEVFVKVKRRLREVFEVESEYGVAAVEGTVFSVRVHDGSRSPVVYECITLEGRVVVQSRNNEWRPLRLESGGAAVINQGNPATRRTLSRNEFNSLVDRVNRVERTYRPTSAELIAPNLVGLTFPTARREATARGVNVSEPVPAVTGTVAIGEIAGQDPIAGGLIRSGGMIRIEIEVEPAIVPNLNGDTLADARRKLSAADLQMGRITDRPLLSGNFDRVVEQSEPAGAKVVPNADIDLVVAVRGASVPSLRGTTENTVRKRLNDAGLVLGSTRRQKGNDQPGRVVDQDPDSGDIVEEGSSVDIVIEQGCTVPGVDDYLEAAAFQEIRNAGLTPRKRNVGRYNQDRVSGTVPAEGTTVRCGSTVQVDFGTNIG